MPQEIEVWYLIPALRRELANIFIKNYNLNQKETAKILGITRATLYEKLKNINMSEKEKDETTVL